MDAEKLNGALDSVIKDLDSKANTKEFKEAKIEFDTKTAELQKSLDRLNEDVNKKEGIIKDLQDGFQELKAKQGKFAANPSKPFTKAQLEYTAMYDLIQKHAPEFASRKLNGQKFELDMKSASAILTSNLSGTPFMDYLDPMLGMQPYGQTRFRSIFQSVPVTNGTVNYTLQNAAPHAGAASYQTEGATKSMIDQTYTNSTATTEYLQCFSKISKQSLEDIPFISTTLPMDLNENLMDVEDNTFGSELFSGAGATFGSALTALSTTYNVQWIVQALAYFGKYTPDFIIMDKKALPFIKLTLPSNFSLPAVAVVTPDGTVTIDGVPVLGVNWLTNRDCIIGQKRYVQIVESAPLNLTQTNSDQDDFVKNLITFLLERREALIVRRPDAIFAAQLPHTN